MSETPSEKRIRDEIRERTLGYILAALGLVAGLAWNDAIKAFIESVFPIGKDSITAKFIYAALITIAVIVLSVQLSKWFGNRESPKK